MKKVTFSLVCYLCLLSGLAVAVENPLIKAERYSPYLRVKLLEPESGKYRVFIMARCARPKEYFTKTYFPEGVSPREFSPWINLNEDGDFSGNAKSMYPGIISAGVHFESLTGEKFKKIKAQIDFAYGPDERKILKTITEDNQGNVVGVFFPRSEVPPDDFAKTFRPILEDVYERNAQVKSLALPPVNLKRYYVVAQLSGRGSFCSDPKFVEVEVNTVKTIGFNALQYGGLAIPYREAAAKEGIFKTQATHRESTYYSLPQKRVTPDKAMLDPYLEKAMRVYPAYRDWVKIGGTVNVLNWDDIRKNFSNAVGTWIIRMKNEDPEQIPLIKFVDLGDEISGPTFAGEEFNEEFRGYLKAKGLTPKDFGKGRWAEVLPISWGLHYHPLPKMRPEDRSDVSACRLYYWSLKYWSWCSAKVYSIATKEIEKRLPGVLTRINFGQPWYNAATDMRGTDVWEFSRQKSITALNNEDWLNTHGGRFTGIQLNAYLTDLNRSCALIHNLGVQAMVMPEGEKHIQRKLASVVGKGAKDIDLFSYGPAYASFDNWSQDFSQVTGVAKFLRKLGKAEDVLYPGKPRKAEVALIWSASDEIWREKAPVEFDSRSADSLYNGHYVYLGLLHKQIPIDFIDEVEIERGRLKEYKVAYLSSRNLRRDTQKVLAEWVRQGGCLWTDALSGPEDEYGQKSDLLLPVLGIKDCQVEESERLDYQPQYGLPQQKPLDTITFKDTGEKVEAIGTKVSFSLINPAQTKVLATFEDNSPAVITHPYGKGKVYYVATLAGISYGWTVKREAGKIETGYQAANRRLITDFPAQVGVTPPLACSVPMVEADLLESAEGIGVVLANYAGEEALPEVRLTIAVPGPVSSVTSAEKGALPFTYNNFKKTVEVSLPLELVDILMLKK